MMASTYLSLNVHIVFCTKNREKWLINPSIRNATHAFLGGTLKTLNCMPLEVGGVADHVHILTGFRATHSIAEIVREMKKASASWFKDKTRRSAFAWQEGYSGFTVSPGGIDGVRAYIQNQEEHHRVKSYQEELLEMLAKAGIEPDMRYFD